MDNPVFHAFLPSLEPLCGVLSRNRISTKDLSVFSRFSTIYHACKDWLG